MSVIPVLTQWMPSDYLSVWATAVVARERQMVWKGEFFSFQLAQGLFCRQARRKTQRCGRNVLVHKQTAGIIDKRGVERSSRGCRASSSFPLQFFTQAVLGHHAKCTILLLFKMEILHSNPISQSMMINHHLWWGRTAFSIPPCNSFEGWC